jgi:hypothetical protein
MDSTIDFTSRYGGEPPGWLTACHGDCEAMGYAPYRPAWVEKRQGRLVANRELCRSRYAGLPPARDAWYDAKWVEAEAEVPSDDGWHFLECYDCRGTGRVSLLRAAARIPRWILKGFRFVRSAPEYRTDHQTRADAYWLAFRCAFLTELRVWSPERGWVWPWRWDR